MFGFLGYKCALLAHAQPLLHQHLQVLLVRPALNLFTLQPGLISGVALTQVQDHHFVLFIEPYDIHIGPLLELVQVLLDGILSFRSVILATLKCWESLWLYHSASEMMGKEWTKHGIEETSEMVPNAPIINGIIDS
ncbi:hypothetical protein BTVI_05753 [Pitangus sulphuratus]|nr:hypothetical protein BTVI_05753 [Pitangus sulphuratus]